MFNNSKNNNIWDNNINSMQIIMRIKRIPEMIVQYRRIGTTRTLKAKKWLPLL